VCVSVCRSGREHIFGATHQFLCMLPKAVARSFAGRVTKSQGEGAVLGVLLPTDNALSPVRCKRDHSISAGKGVMGVHSADEVCYDCVVQLTVLRIHYSSLFTHFH